MALTTNVPRPNLQKTSYLRNGMSSDIEGVKFPLQSGVPIQNLYMFKVIPASFSATCVSSANYWLSGGQPLNQVDTGSKPNIISTALNLKNITGFGISNRDVTGILLDCERCLTFTFGGGTTITSTTVTVKGFDYLGTAIEFSSVISGSVTSVTLLQPISIVTSIAFSNDFNSEGSEGLQTVSVGNSNIIGLPYYLKDYSYVMGVSWAGTALASTTATAGKNWRVSDPSSTPSPVRGCVTLPTATDGASLLTCCYYVYGSDSELNAGINNANQSALKVASIQISTGPKEQNVVPFLTKYDLTGVVYPGDNNFIYAYNQAKLF